MQVVLPQQALPAKLELNPDLRMDDDAFYEFCIANPDLWIERTAQGEIIIVPPAGLESDDQNAEVVAQLRIWAKRDRRGKACGPTAEFILQTGAILAPDAAWVSQKRLSKLSKEQLRKFPRVCPEFIVEVMSPSDGVKTAQRKMEEWMRAGVDLGWLIHGDERTVYIYRIGQGEPEQRTGITEIAGEGPVEGFKLDLTDVWAGL